MLLHDFVSVEEEDMLLKFFETKTWAIYKNRHVSILTRIYHSLQSKVVLIYIVGK
jgi:hypothetical protein